MSRLLFEKRLVNSKSHCLSEHIPTVTPRRLNQAMAFFQEIWRRSKWTVPRRRPGSAGGRTHQWRCTEKSLSSDPQYSALEQPDVNLYALTDRGHLFIGLGE